MNAAIIINKKHIVLRIVTDLCSGLLILLFIYTGISKLTDTAQFQNTMEKSPVLATDAKMLSWLIPGIELCLAAMLFFPLTRKAGFLLSSLLLIAFTGYILYMLKSVAAKDLPCSCGGVVSTLTWKAHIPFNLLFLFLAISGYTLSFKAGKERNHSPP